MQAQIFIKLLQLGFDPEKSVSLFLPNRYSFVRESESLLLNPANTTFLHNLPTKWAITCAVRRAPLNP